MSVIEMNDKEMTETEMIAKVARTLLVLENREELYLCDYLTDCVLKLHDSLKTIMPVLKCSGVIEIIDLNILNSALKELHSVLVSTFLPDEIYTVSESSCVYERLECCLSDLFKTCKFMDVSDIDVSVWDNTNPGFSAMRDAAMSCVSSLLDCTKILQDVLIGRLASCQDMRSYYSRRRVELKRILDVFEEGRE
jgi:hypothetical protein